MGLLLLEALGVLGIAIFIVWWTMFSGRRRDDGATPPADPPRADDLAGSIGPDGPEGSGTAGGSSGSRRTGPGAD